MQTLSQLEANSINYPNSIELNQALAEAYARDERWQDSVKIYQRVVELYPAIAALNINRIRLGAIALAISSFLFLVSQILDPTRFAFEPYDFVTLPAFAVSNILFLPVLTLLSCAAISIYKLLSTSGKNRPAFWAMVSIVIGSGLFLPYFGIKAVILPAAAHLYFQGETGGFDVYAAALQQPIAVVFTLGGYMLFVGLTIFNVAIWESTYLSKWASTLLWIGWSLFIITEGLPFNFVVEVLRISNPIIYSILVVIGGMGLGRGLWQQAPLQLAPGTDSTQQADS